jgi:hypothetical protein
MHLRSEIPRVFLPAKKKSTHKNQIRTTQAPQSNYLLPARNAYQKCVRRQIVEIRRRRRTQVS